MSEDSSEKKGGARDSSSGGWLETVRLRSGCRWANVTEWWRSEGALARRVPDSQDMKKVEAEEKYSARDLSEVKRGGLSE